MPSAIPMRSLRMEDDLYLKLKYIASEENRSFNQEAVYILKTFVDEYETQHGSISVQTDDLYR